MCTIQEMRNICNDIAQAAGYEIKVPIEENSRLSSTLGRVKYKWLNPYKETIMATIIEFNSRYLENASDADLKDLAKHELAHYFVSVETKKSHGHDAVFKEMCRKLGTKEDGTIFGQGSSQFKYTIKCPKCGKVIAEKKRKCAATDNAEKTDSPCCGVKMICIQNY